MARTRKFSSILQVFEIALIGALTLCVGGFFVFVSYILQQKPVTPAVSTDALAVLTGGTNRMDAGLALMADKKAKNMLITGVYPDVTRDQLIDRWNADDARKKALRAQCCITLDYAADTTEANAQQTAAWLPRGTRSLRIVTSDYHMPRTLVLFQRAMPDVTLYPWPVHPSEFAVTGLPFWQNALREFGKFLMTWLQ